MFPAAPCLACYCFAAEVHSSKGGFLSNIFQRENLEKSCSLRCTAVSFRPGWPCTEATQPYRFWLLANIWPPLGSAICAFPRPLYGASKYGSRSNLCSAQALTGLPGAACSAPSRSANPFGAGQLAGFDTTGESYGNARETDFPEPRKRRKQKLRQTKR